MQVTVTARHCEITEELRARAEAVMERLSQLTPFEQAGTIVFDVEGLSQVAEIRIHLSGGRVLVSRGDGVDHRSALDQAESRMRRQLDRPGARVGRDRRGAAQA